MSQNPEQSQEKPFTMTFLGTGSAFCIKNWQSNMLITAPSGKSLLLDCGADARRSMAEIGKNHRHIDAVYVSHLHSDHIGGLEWLGFSSRFDPEAAKPKLFASRSITSNIWQTSLEGGMKSLEGMDAGMADFFCVNPVPRNGAFEWEGIEFQLIQVIHIVSEFSVEPAYGLLFTINGITVFWSSDAQFAPNQIKAFYDKAAIIFHDCETSPFKSGVHAHFDELSTLPPATRAKMWLYHYQDGKLPDARSAGFLGFIPKGAVFDFSGISNFWPDVITPATSEHMADQGMDFAPARDAG